MIMIWNEIVDILNFILKNLLQIWPYLLITVPLAVAVHLSGISRYISRAFAAQPLIAIVLATVVGAFSPFCSCTVIPVIASLLLSGVPLAPVMSFWLASPSMDPEIFFLSVASIGWNLALWRLGVTFALSLSAGFITHVLVQRGWLGNQYLRQRPQTNVPTTWAVLKNGWQRLSTTVAGGLAQRATASALLPTSSSSACCAPASASIELSPQVASSSACCAPTTASIELVPRERLGATASFTSTATCTAVESSCTTSSGCGCGTTESGCQGAAPTSLRNRLFKETWDATTMVITYMILAFLLEALIIKYVPSAWIAGLLGSDQPWAVVTAAIIGVPVYTSTLAALGMVSGLLVQGMTPAAALAFLIAGPTTTLPAMAAVWGLASRRVFLLYLGFALFGAIVFGYLYQILM